MERIKIKRSPPSENNSQIGDKNSRISEISINSLISNIKRLFNFSEVHIPGLYRITSRHFILEYCESDAIAYSKFHINSEQFIPIFIEDELTINGIQYCGYIDIQYSTTDIAKILIPAYRSYDPAGTPGQQYINSRQFMIMLKLFSVEIRAAQLGVRERRMEKIKTNIESISKIPGPMY